MSRVINLGHREMMVKSKRNVPESWWKRASSKRIQKEHSVRQTEDPLVWLLHGPPGTGKSHVLGFLRQLFELVGYTYGLDYEVVAFQAVNAADLKGKTIHSAFGFDRQNQGDKAASEEVTKKMAHWRWLIMDEVSLTDAKLLAQMEQRLRFAVPGASPWRQDLHGRLRPFGGVNVIFTGDFHQLPPPQKFLEQFRLRNYSSLIQNLTL